MSQPYIGEIRMFGGNFAPVGWAMCQGQLTPISQNDALFNLIGTTYGGDGQQTFGLPDLQGRCPVHMGTYQGNTYQQGEKDGTESVTLTTSQIPGHTHAFLASQDNATGAAPGNTVVPANSLQVKIYSAFPTTATMSPSVQNVGGSQPHENMMPYLCITFIIALYGVFPSPN